MKVFLSSSYEDLKAYRSVLLDTLQKMGDYLQIVAMEHFGADPRPALEVCQDKVAECDAYIGIFGWRYGSIDQTSRLSMTEIEYRTALARNIPTFLYLLSEDQAVPPATIDTGVGASKLRRLKREIAGRHVFQKFTTPEDLSRLVAADLGRHLRAEVQHKEPVDISGPVGPEVNSSHPYMLCHVNQPSDRFPGFFGYGRERTYHHIRLYIDLYTEEIGDRKELLQAVDRVVYQLHETFLIPVVPMQNWEECFVFDCWGWGEFWVRATIQFRDKASPPYHLTRFINLDVPDELRQTV